MKTFVSQIKSHTQIRHSFCVRMLLTTTCALAFGIIGLQQAASAAAPTSITTCPYVINSPGEYRLDVDCSVGPNETAIAIEASDVYLNLRGHTISGPGLRCSDSSVGIYVSGSDVHIINGTIKGGFRGGIFVSSPADHTHLNELTLTENCTGLLIRDSTDNHVESCNISANIGDGVELLQNSNNNKIAGNVINANGFGPEENGGGLALDTSHDNTIASNELSGNNNGVSVGSSVHAVQAATRNTILDNTLTGNTEYGIRVNPGSSENVIEGNTASGHKVDLGDFNLPACINTWESNTFVTDSESDGPGAGCIQ